MLTLANYPTLGDAPVNMLDPVYPPPDKNADTKIADYQRQLNRYADLVGFAPVQVSGRVDRWTFSAGMAHAHYLWGVDYGQSETGTGLLIELYRSLAQAPSYQYFSSYLSNREVDVAADMKATADKLGLPAVVEPPKDKWTYVFYGSLIASGIYVGLDIIGWLITRHKRAGDRR